MSQDLNDFDIDRKLGEGSYSSVYKVIRKKDGKQYAMKKIKLGNLSAKERENAVNEIRFLASINSPFIIGYKDSIFEEITYSLHIIMEYMEGGDMLQKIRHLKQKQKFMNENQIWHYIIQLLKGIKSLHDLNILHRDLKNANLFLSKDHKVVKLGDFNVSKINKQGLLYTQTGTPYYASPEVWRDKPYNSKSDIWSLGCVFYEIIALKPPFHASDMETLYKKVQKGAFDSIPNEFSSDLVWLINQCLQVNPKQRPSAEQLLNSPQLKKHQGDLEEHQQIKFQEDEQKSILLSTIKIPKGLKGLMKQLPFPKYSESDILQNVVNNNSNGQQKNNQNNQIQNYQQSRKESKSACHNLNSDEKENADESQENNYQIKKHQVSSPSKQNVNNERNKNKNVSMNQLDKKLRNPLQNQIQQDNRIQHNKSIRILTEQNEENNKKQQLIKQFIHVDYNQQYHLNKGLKLNQFSQQSLNSKLNDSSLNNYDNKKLKQISQNISIIQNSIQDQSITSPRLPSINPALLKKKQQRVSDSIQKPNFNSDVTNNSQILKESNIFNIYSPNTKQLNQLQQKKQLKLQMIPQSTPNMLAKLSLQRETLVNAGRKLFA